ncbi:MAG: methylaspartate mutase subunit E, partial [Nitrososphaeria archaeon]|nr:methylaspartate mutase subunit E [Nitrososphaeria archaeon]NIQ33841.1 methylaspartate mutase subunit E [Nitrososphaeria archaeon]
MKNEKLSDEEFWNERNGVLRLWRTGKEIDIDEAIEYHRNLPLGRRGVLAYNKAREVGIPLAMPRGGWALLEQEIEFVKYMREVGQADLMAISVDTYTRRGQYEQAEKAVEESRKIG